MSRDVTRQTSMSVSGFNPVVDNEVRQSLMLLKNGMVAKTGVLPTSNVLNNIAVDAKVLKRLKMTPMHLEIRVNARSYEQTPTGVIAYPTTNKYQCSPILNTGHAPFVLHRCEEDLRRSRTS